MQGKKYWHSTHVFEQNLFTLDRLRSRKDAREVGLASFRLIDHVEKQTAAMDEIHASTINANCALTTTKHTKTVIMDFIKKVIILFLHLQKQVTDKKHEQKASRCICSLF